MTATTPTPPPPPRARVPVITFVIVPLIIAGVAYTWDIVFGAADIPAPGATGASIQRWAIVTAGFCLFEALVGAALLVRHHRLASATGLVLYLVVVAAVALQFGLYRG